MRIILSLILIMLSLGNLNAQIKDYNFFENIKLDNKAFQVNCFVQDSLGLMWIGTEKGLYSFDGYSSQQHFLVEGEYKVQIHCAASLDSERLCLGTDNGILVYNVKYDKYEKIWKAQFPTDLRTLSVVDSATLLLGALDGFYRYDIKHDRLRKFEATHYEGLPHQAVYSIIKATNDSIYVGTYDGFCKFMPQTNSFTAIDLPLNPRKSNHFISSLLEDTQNKCIWIGTEGTLYKYSFDTRKAEKINLISDVSIKSLGLDKDNNLLLGTDNGLYIYNNQTKELHNSIHDSRDHQSLANNSIWSIFVDKNKNSWLGTEYGISLSCNDNSFRFNPIFELTGIPDGNRFSSILKDSKDTFWFGGTNGLIKALDWTSKKNNAVWYRMDNAIHPLPNNRINSIYEDRDNKLWIATDGSINLYDRAQKQFANYVVIDSTHTYNSNWAYSIFEDNKGNLWIGTWLGGVFVVDKSKLLNKNGGTYIAEKNYNLKDGLQSNFVISSVYDPQGNVWVLMYKAGLNKIEVDTDSIKRIVPENTDLSDCTCMICDKDGFIWLGTQHEIVKINSRTEETKLIKLNDFNNLEILSFAEVNNRIWIVTSEDILILDKKTEKIRLLNTSGHSFFTLYFDEPTNKLYLGGVDGFSVILPDKIKAEDYNRPVIISALFINGKRYEPNNAKHGEKSIRYLDAIQLKSNQNNLSFEFSDFIFSKEQQSQFVYKLEDYDMGWTALDTKTNRINYSNLKYGDYRLIIKKQNEADDDSEIVKIFSLSIAPPWYYTTWAKILYLLLFVTLVVWIINFFRARNNLKIERIEREKSLELSNMKIEFFTDISHELKTPLSLIIAPVSRLLAKTKNTEDKKQLETVQRNASKLNSLIHQMLDFRRKDYLFNADLILSQVEFVEFARTIFSIHQNNYKSQELNFQFVTNEDKIYLELDALKMESVLNNLISNSCKYTNNGGTVALELKSQPEDGVLKIIVSDTGVGIPSKEIPLIFERFYQSSKTIKLQKGTGIGLYLVKSYVELHKGNIEVVSEEDAGTSLTISLPLAVGGASAENEELPQIENPNQSQQLILIVEDIPEISSLLSQILSPYYHCKIAQNGKEGLEKALQIRPDLILSDVMMPIMDGISMCKQIRMHKQFATTPIILLTAKDDSNTELESINTKVDAFMSKPFEPDVLLSRINQLINKTNEIQEKIRIEKITEPKLEEDTVSQDEKFLSGITQIIEDNISNFNLNVNALSDISGISQKQIYRKTIQLTNLSPVKYIKSIRMKKAAMLLAQKKFSIAEVMYMVGYSSTSYFSKSFYSEFGKTPQEFMSDCE